MCYCAGSHRNAPAFALLPLLGQARQVAGVELSLRPLPCGMPLVVFPPVSREASVCCLARLFHGFSGRLIVNRLAVLYGAYRAAMLRSIRLRTAALHQ
jgi:hypothetical protein